MVGGENVIVEIDESKFCSRKFNRGHEVPGCWVFGGVDRTNERNIFAVVVADRTAHTLIANIRRYIRPGSIIYTDCWAAYNDLDLLDAGFQHGSVNHTYNYVDPLSNVHINTIEGTWNGIKRNINARLYTPELVQGKLWEFVWRRRYPKSWDRMILIMKYIIVGFPEEMVNEDDNQV